MEVSISLFLTTDPQLSDHMLPSIGLECEIRRTRLFSLDINYTFQVGIKLKHLVFGSLKMKALVYRRYSGNATYVE